VAQSTRPDHPNPEHRPDRALRSVGRYDPLGTHGGSPAACTIDDCRRYDIVVLYEFDNLLSEPEVGQAMGTGGLQYDGLEFVLGATRAGRGAVCLLRLAGAPIRRALGLR
jgi:hypothetical protein